MNHLCTLAVFSLLGASCVLAQVDFAPNPMIPSGKIKKRPIGSGADPGASIDSGKTPDESARYVTHIILFEYRMWSNAEGKPLEAKLIAFEDLVAQAPKGEKPPAMPAPPAHPTVTRGGKVRLLVNQKPVEVALDKLSLADQEFIDQIKAALAKKAAAALSPPE